jgi:YesN/AraC family two-component response regulator
LLTDVVMPKLNGRELSEKLAGIHPETRTLFTSGYTENIIAHHGVLDKGIKFLGKPYTLEALARRVRDLLDG